MKIRLDYVTNSSSTSFIIISKGKPNKSIFLEALGIKHGSHLEHFGKELFELLCSKMKNVKEAIESEYWGAPHNVKSLLEKNINSPSIIKKVEQALNAGMNVYIGTLDSDGGSPENFLCTETFEIDSPELYINALESGW